MAVEHWVTDTMNQSNVAYVENVKNTKRSLFQAELAQQVCSAVNCLDEATHFELEHGRLRLAVRLCAFHFEELCRLVKRQGKDWGATACDWRDARLWAASKSLKSGL